MYLDLRWTPAWRRCCSNHPNWGRSSKINPRRNPERNPPICAKLSTCGNIPMARLMTIINRSVNKVRKIISSWPNRGITTIWKEIHYPIYHWKLLCYLNPLAAQVLSLQLFPNSNTKYKNKITSKKVKEKKTPKKYNKEDLQRAIYSHNMRK